MSWPSMYAISGASGESLALETGLSVNVWFGSTAVIVAQIAWMALKHLEAASRLI